MSSPCRPAYPTAYATPARPPARVWDIVLTSVLLLLLVCLTAIVSYFGFFLAMASDPCGAVECDEGLIGIGMLTAVVLPWLVFVAVLVVSIMRLVRRRLGFWLPLAAVPLVVGSWFVGAAIASAGVPT
ncbi:DUF6264 family protein [Microbacterium sp.]|uniref:DUF6264 family protein n=1 Tax=Microbacterium sp. TaxID=51671 RepID=UPI003221B040